MNIKERFIQKNYWIRGVIIGFLLFLLEWPLSLICSKGCSSLGCMICFIPGVILVIPTNLLVNIFSLIFRLNLEYDLVRSLVISNLFTFILFGAIIGLIIGKIKLRKK